MPNFRFIEERHIYYALITLRVGFALLGPGYIHPDEHFQNGEIVAGKQMGVHSLRTWEWDPTNPIRSIIPPTLTSGYGYLFIKLYWTDANVPPQIMFLVERLAHLVYSLFLDMAVYELVPDNACRMRALILLASSFVTLTFQVRPFTNSFEAVILAYCLVSLSRLFRRRLNGQHTWSNGDLVEIAWRIVLGLFTRTSFVAFALPICLATLQWMLQAASVTQAAGPTGSRLLMWTRLLYPPIATTIVSTLIIVGLDSIYYQNALWPLILTPLNFLRYNMSTANLAQHGLHPRWLHALVNYPMLIGPLLYYVVAAGMQLVRPPRGVFGSEKPEQEQTPEIRGRDTDSILTITCLSVIVSGIGILSVVPHQEPRFLVPLVIPSIVLVARCGFMRQPSKLFWVSWIVMNALMTPLFGVLHQGGVVPSLFKLHSKVQQARLSEPFDPEFSDAAVNVLYWRTYMPPWHLLSVPEQAVQSGEVALTDLAGAPASEVVDKLRRLAPSTRSYLVAPLYSARIIATDHPECFALEQRVFPHLDLDHIVETLELGWRDGLSLGIYSVDTSCLQA